MPIAQPEVTATLRAAGTTAGLTPQKLLFVGQKNGGSATSGALVTNLLNDGAEDTLFGADSPIATAIRRARRRNTETQFDAIGLDDAGGATAATGTITIAGPATEAGTLTFFVGSKKFNVYTIAVSNADTATTIAGNLVTAITNDTTALVGASNVAGVVTLTANNGGTFGNTIGVKATGGVGGVTVTLVAMSGGATDPTLTNVFDVVGNERYQGVVWQFDQNISVLTDFLDPRFNVTNNVLDGVGFVGRTDSFANHLTALGSLNSQSLCYNASKIIAEANHQGAAILDVPFTKVAEFAAIRSLRRTEDAVLGDLVIARSSLDSFGGPHTNSKPYSNTPLPDLLVPDVGDSFTDTEIEQLKAAGGWVLDANRAFSAVIAGEVVTTYLTDSAGNPDPTFTFLNYVDTASAAREYIVNNTRAKYAQYRATTGALVNNVDSANEASVAAFVAELNGDLGDLGLVNTGLGSINNVPIDFDKEFRKNLTVTLNPTTGAFTVSAKLFIVVQLRSVTYDLAIAFEV